MTPVPPGIRSLRRLLAIAATFVVVAAWALANDPALQPASPTASDDWGTSLDRQIELFQWLQSPEGGIAGGSTNSWDGHYADRPDDVATFYGMAYTEAPVYHDPPSNSWMGMQGWGVERIAQLYEETGDERAEAILDKWVPWVIDHVTVTDDSWQIPSNLAWSGQPDAIFVLAADTGCGAAYNAVRTIGITATMYYVGACAAPNITDAAGPDVVSDAMGGVSRARSGPACGGRACRWR